MSQEIKPLGIDYARAVVDEAPSLDRVQQMLPHIPSGIAEYFHTQSDDFLFGVSTIVQATHDLIGNTILDDMGKLVEANLGNPDSHGILAVVGDSVKLVAVMETLGFIACQELVARADAEKD
jgi:hypothetical protein